VRSAIAWPLALLCAAWAAVRLFGLERGFPLVPLIAFTPFVIALAAAAFVIAALLRRRTAALVAAVAGLVLALLVAPRALGGPTEPDGTRGPTLRVLTVNTRYGRASPEVIVALVKRTRADVLSVQELTPNLIVGLDRAGLGDEMPFYTLEPKLGADGTGLYARMRLQPAPRPVGTQSAMAAAATRVPGGPMVQLLAVHPAAPDPGSVDEWRQDLNALPDAEPRGRFRVLAGDFNATLDHAELRQLIGTGYEDAASVVGAGLHGTWPEGRKVPPAVVIDHVLADKRAGVRAVSVHTIPGTDHRAVFAELVLPRR